MKKFKYVCLSLLLFMLSCSKTPLYQLNDQNDNKNYLNRIINEYKTKGFQYEYPSLVVDGFLIKNKGFHRIEKVNLKKCEMELIHFLNPKGAESIYGTIGKNGIILIRTRNCIENVEPKITDNLK